MFECKECGKSEDETRWYPETGLRLLKGKLCHNCDFWTEKIALMNDPNHAPKLVRTYDFKHNWIGDENENVSPNSRGFGGRKFKIRFDDGREVTTTNLWHQGTIPLHFRDRLLPNAKIQSY